MWAGRRSLTSYDEVDVTVTSKRTSSRLYPCPEGYKESFLSPHGFFSSSYYSDNGLRPLIRLSHFGTRLLPSTLTPPLYISSTPTSTFRILNMSCVQNNQPSRGGRGGRGGRGNRGGASSGNRYETPRHRRIPSLGGTQPLSPPQTQALLVPGRRLPPVVYHDEEEIPLCAGLILSATVGATRIPTTTTTPI
jgi:hypothetical protein